MNIFYHFLFISPQLQVMLPDTPPDLHMHNSARIAMKYTLSPISFKPPTHATHLESRTWKCLKNGSFRGATIDKLTP